MFTFKQSQINLYKKIIDCYEEVIPDIWSSTFENGTLMLFDDNKKRIMEVSKDSYVVYINFRYLDMILDIFNIPEFHFDIDEYYDFNSFGSVNVTSYLTNQLLNCMILYNKAVPYQENKMVYVDFIVHEYDNVTQEITYNTDYTDEDEKLLLSEYKNLRCIKFYDCSSKVVDAQYAKFLFEQMENLKWVYIKNTEYSIDSQQEYDFELRVIEDYCDYVGSTRPRYVFNKTYGKK